MEVLPLPGGPYRKIEVPELTAGPIWLMFFQKAPDQLGLAALFVHEQ